MEKFAEFIINYIQENPIHGKIGWTDQLSSYSWKVRHGFDHLPEMIRKTKEYWVESEIALTSSPEEWLNYCNKIQVWGHMATISPDLAEAYKQSVLYLRDHDPVTPNDFSSHHFVSKRIATSSKIYYFSNPLRWTIYDSRVAYAIHQLLYEYSKEKNKEPEDLFPATLLCLPESHTSRRIPLYDVPSCNETRTRISFIWASYLHRQIADKLNCNNSIQKPSQYLSSSPQWELPHVEMVLFMLGDKQWVSTKERE
jgi:hypothetical protein